MLKAFANIPNEFHGEDPSYATRPLREELKRLKPSHPYFQHAEAALFLAPGKEGAWAGRISAQVDALEQKNSPELGHFGFLEACDSSVMEALLEKAESWLRERGVRQVTGPFDFSINDVCGLPIEGFDEPARVMTSYAPAWYKDALERIGYSKEKDLLAYDYLVSQGISTPVQKMSKRAWDMDGLKVRSLNRRRFDEDLATVVALFNDAWSSNWGFVPMTEAEAKLIADALKPVLPAELVWFVEIRNRPVGMVVALPDLNEALEGLGPTLGVQGWARALWRYRVRGLQRSRVILMGVSKSLGDGAVSAGVASLLIERIQNSLKKRGFKRLELSWVLEDNRSMRSLLELLKCRVYKRYRIYGKSL